MYTIIWQKNFLIKCVCLVWFGLMTHTGSGQPPPYAAVQKGDLYGLTDTSGKWLMVPQYAYLRAALPHLLEVRQNSRYAFINLQGETVFAAPDSLRTLIGNFSEGLVRVFYSAVKRTTLLKEENHGALLYDTVSTSVPLNKYAFWSKKGKVIGTLLFDGAMSFSEGLAAVNKGGKPHLAGISTKGGQWGFINSQGKTVIPCRYDSVTSFSEGVAAAKKGKKWGYINHKGQWVVTPRFTLAEPFAQGRAWVQTRGKYYLINTTGQKQHQASFDFGADFSEGWAVVNRGGKVKQYEWINHYYAEGGKWGFCDASGRVVVALKYDDAQAFHQGVAPVKIHHKWGAINPKGKMIIPAKYEEISFFSEGLIAVKHGGKWGFANRRGKLVIPCRFDQAKRFSARRAAVKKDKLWGYINPAGQWVIEPRYKRADSFYIHTKK